MTTAAILFGLLVAPCFAARLLRLSAGNGEWAGVLGPTAILPFNLCAAVQRGAMGGHAWGPVHLWIRVPLQRVLMLWAGRFTTRTGREPAAAAA